MQYFIGIVPPDEYLERIVSFQKRWSSNGLPDVVEPHVTVKAQSGLTLDMAWLENSPFDFGSNVLGDESIRNSGNEI